MAKKDTTAQDIPVQTEVSDAEVAAFDIQPHLVNMLLTEPFFAEIMRNITKVRDDKMPTAGVTVKDADLYLYWSGKFFAGLKSEEIFGVLKHECYHLIFNHCTTRRLDPHFIHNIATDLAINCLIPENELPKFCLRPGKPLDLSKVTDPKALAQWTAISEKIKSFPEKESSEWYFGQLMDDPTIQQMMAEGAPGFGIGEGDPDGEGEGSVPGQIDQHGGWDNMSDEERQIAQHKVKEALRQAVRKCDRNGQWGTIPASTREELRRLASDAVDWKKVLQNFAGTRQRMNKAHTMRRINRKYPYIHPGVQRSHTAHIGVFVDMSGSVSDADLEQVYAVLGSLAKKVTFTFLPFDYTVDEANKFEWKKGKKQDPIRFRSGGTSFIAVNEYVKKNRDLFDGIIICTDGEAEDPGPSPVRRCWVLVPGTKLIFPATPGDVVVSMDKAKANLQAA